MDTQYQTRITRPHQQYQKHQQNQMTTKPMLISTIAGITIGGPLLALMGFFFLSTMTLFVIASPVLIIFSPLIMGAIFVLSAALVGFAMAGAMAIVGLAALGWVLKSVKVENWRGSGLQSSMGKLVDYGENVKENAKDTGKEWASNLKLTVQNENEDKTDKTDKSANRT